MEFLIPPKEQDEFYICQQKSIDSGYELIENNFSDEFDYKIKSVFDGENFMINLYRNEFDVDKIPENVFREERFMRYPYRKEDFKAIKEKHLWYDWEDSKCFTANSCTKKGTGRVNQRWAKCGKKNFWIGLWEHIL